MTDAVLFWEKIGNLRGPIGARGPIGLQGEGGKDGEQGEAGPPGPQGIPGPPGAKGDEGLHGPMGPPGPIGAEGQRGPPGAAGPVGAEGPIGRRGPIGEPGPQGPSGDQGPPGEQGRQGDVGPPGDRGPPGFLTKIADGWKPETITDAHQLVYYAGATWQALRTNASEPAAGSPDWQLVAAAGAAGKDGRSFVLRGTFDPTTTYRALDVVTLNGSWFGAVRDNPGPCPGDNWRVGPSGRRGDRGERGDPGPQGPAGKDGRDAREWVGVHVNRETYSIALVMDDGSLGPEISLRGLFEQFLIEQRGGS